MAVDTWITVIWIGSVEDDVVCHPNLQTHYSDRLVLISDDQICISRSQITNDSAPFETLFGCQTTSHDNSSAKQNWFCFLNKGLGGSGWLRGKRKGSAREHCQRKVQICFSRQDRFWLWAPFLPCDSYVMFIKLACITGAKWSETNGAFGAAAFIIFWQLCGNYLQQTYAAEVQCAVEKKTNAHKQTFEIIWNFRFKRQQVD